jgi:hypothetical protein
MLFAFLFVSFLPSHMQAAEQYEERCLDVRRLQELEARGQTDDMTKRDFVKVHSRLANQPSTTPPLLVDEGIVPFSCPRIHGSVLITRFKKILTRPSRSAKKQVKFYSLSFPVLSSLLLFSPLFSSLRTLTTVEDVRKSIAGYNSQLGKWVDDMLSACNVRASFSPTSPIPIP